MVVGKCLDFRDWSVMIKDLIVCAYDIILLEGLQSWSMKGAEYIAWLQTNAYNLGEKHQGRATLTYMVGQNGNALANRMETGYCSEMNQDRVKVDSRNATFITY
jgi:hypothetical protein